MATPAQIAALIRQRAAAAGLGANRQGELVDAAYAESGLNPAAVNKSSGAAGLFQLLSPGYVQRAHKLGGGPTDPAANIGAILPDYVNYWKTHPNAAPGEAARDVERSGMGASFYINDASERYGGGTYTPAVAAPAADANSRPTQSSTGLSPTAQLGLTLASQVGKGGDLAGFTRSLLDWRAGQQQPEVAPTAQTPAPQQGMAAFAPATGTARTGPAEAFYDPLGSYDNGRFGGPIGHHSDHVHISETDPQAMLAAIARARSMGLTVRENPYVDPVDPVHVTGSYHYKTFPGRFNGRQLGEAIDVSGPPASMAAFYKAMVPGGPKG